jgi:hypothetical protein
LFVEITHGGAVLRELDDLRSLSVRHPATAARDEVASALHREDLGLLDGDGHAWLDIQWLLDAGAAQGPRWSQDFSGMIGFAQSRGWVRDGRVRAHLEAVET